MKIILISVGLAGVVSCFIDGEYLAALWAVNYVLLAKQI